MAKYRGKNVIFSPHVHISGIFPSGNQDITTLDEYDVTAKATARVSAGERAKIIPDNIKKDVTLLGITGTFEGGGSEPVEEKDVNFYDYDGTLLYSYTKTEFLALSSLPANPTHEGLTAQGWNWTFADATQAVTDYGVLDVGQNYITDDGKTRLYITIDEYKVGKTLTLYFNQSKRSGVSVQWGDDQIIDVVDQTGNVNVTHTYSQAGNYVISLEVENGCVLKLGNETPAGNIFKSTETSRFFDGILSKVELGRNITVMTSYTFFQMQMLQSITLPLGITYIGSYSFQECYLLKHINFPIGFERISVGIFTNGGIETFSTPKSLYQIDYTAFNGSYNLKKVVIVSTINAQSKYSAFLNCWRLKTMILSKSENSGNYFVQNAYNLTKIMIGVMNSSLGAYSFAGLRLLNYMKVTKEVASIASNTFNGNVSMQKYDFSEHTGIPTLTNTNAFSGIPADCKIVVPDSLYDDWIATTNWVSLASHIVKASEA